jgi:hypothetical protein
LNVIGSIPEEWRKSENAVFHCKFHLRVIPQVIPAQNKGGQWSVQLKAAEIALDIPDEVKAKSVLSDEANAIVQHLFNQPVYLTTEQVQKLKSEGQILFLLNPYLNHVKTWKYDTIAINLKNPNGMAENKPSGPVSITKVESSNLEIAYAKLRGFHKLLTPPPEVAEPVLPRWYVNPEGHPAVDLDSDELNHAGALTIQQLDADGNVEKETTITQPATAGHAALRKSFDWYSLDLAEAFDWGEHTVYAVHNVSFRVILSGVGFLWQWTSPFIDRYRVLDWLTRRAEYLAETLFSIDFHTARRYTPAHRKKTAWSYFIQAGKHELVITVTNPSEDTVRNQPVYIYALYGAGHKPPFDQKHVELVSLGSGEPTVLQSKLEIEKWEVEDLRDLVGLHLATGESALENVRAGTQNVSSVILRVSIDLDDPRRTAARIMYENLRDPEAIDYGGLSVEAESVAEAFMADEPGSPLSASAIGQIIQAQAAARNWKARIEEFEHLLKIMNEAFATSEVRELHEQLHDNQTTIHIGAPREPTATIYATGGSRGWDIYKRYLLRKPNSESIWRGIMSAATGGVATGDVPVFSDEETLERDFAKMRRLGRYYDSREWKTPGFYADAFLELSTEDLAAFKVAVEAKMPLSKVKGELMEALMARQVGRKWAKENLKSGKSAFIMGAKVRDYWSHGDKLGGTGAQATDGLVVSVKGNRIVIHQIYEAKSGTAGVEDAPDQLSKHRRRLEHRGLTIINPSPEEIKLLGHIARQGTRKISGEESRYLHVPKGRIEFPPAGEGGILVTAKDIANSNVANRQVNLRREQVERLAAKFIREKGGTPELPWASPLLSLQGYKLFYRDHLIHDPAKRVSDKELKHHYLQGERWNPDKKKWVKIYTTVPKSKVANIDPFMSEREFIDAYKKHRGNRLSVAELDRAREKFRDGWRYNKGRRWFRPAHLLHPQDPYATQDEILEIWRRGTNPKNRMSEAEASKKIADGYTWDWTASGDNKWRKRRTVDDPKLTKDAYMRTYKGLHPNASKKHLERVAKSFDRGWVFDWNQPEWHSDEPEKRKSRWRKRRYGADGKTKPPPLKQFGAPDAELNDLRQAAARRARLRTVGSAGEVALGLLRNFGTEWQRVSQLRLEVLVRRKTGSEHTFVIVYQGHEDPHGRLHPGAILTPVQQKWLLQQWFRGSAGFMTEGGIPLWLLNATPDGDQYDWYGPR